MATVIKKISELDHMEELTSSSNVIIEENGEAKRFSAASLGKVKTVNGVEPDENGNIEVEVGGSGGGVSSWNDLTDRPFYEENVVLDIHWDGEIGDREYVDLSGDGSQIMVHVSDYTFTKELVGTTIGFTVTDDNGVTTDETIVLPSEHVVSYLGITMIGESQAVVIPYDNFEFMGELIFPKAGLYFAKTEGQFVTTSLTGEATVVHKLDEKYTDNPLVINITDMENPEVDYDAVQKAYNNNDGVFVRINDNLCSANILCVPASADMPIDIYVVTFSIGELNTASGDIPSVDKYNFGIFVLPAMMGGAEFIELPTIPPATEEPSLIVSHGYGYEPVPMEEVLEMALPPVGDDGQILGVVDGAWVPMDAPSGLPEVTADKNGNVLTVVDGAWSAMDAPSGLPEVTTENNGNVLTVVDGAWSVGEIEIPTVPTTMPNPNAVTFTGAVEATYDGSSAVSIEIPKLPEATADNDGAFLRIVDGVPTWVMLEIAEEGAY